MSKIEHMQFIKTLHPQISKKGKIIVLSGMSGSGKTFIANLLTKKFNCVNIPKYVTRPFRKEEIRAKMNGEAPGIRAVFGEFNDGEKTDIEQENLSLQRKKAFLNKKCPLAYINYGEYYGFSTDEINNYIENGKTVVIIINNIDLIKDLKNIYGNECISCYIHKELPNVSYFVELSKQRDLNSESTKKRYDKSKKDYIEFINNKDIFDYTILNMEDGIATLELQLHKILQTPLKKKKTTNMYVPKVFVFSGSPGSGKDDALEIISVIGPLHSVIMPKMTTRKRRPEDGTELICSNDEKYNLDSCDLQYQNYGNTYGIDTSILKRGLEEGISFSISISDMPTIKLLQKKFPNSVVPIYIQGQKFEDFAKANQDDQTEYMQRHLSGYHTSYQSYCEHITDYAKVVINDGDITDLSKQITGIISSYETSRDLSGNLYREYLQKAQKYVNYAQTHSLELN